jgi:PadR family transcriptional regulator PadR
MALLRGTLDVLVLKTLSWGPMHAFEITSWLEERSGGRLNIVDAALLQALHRLEGRDVIASDWGMTGNGRRARYYRLTPEGRTALKNELAEMSDSIDTLWAVLSAKTLEP